MATRRYFVNPKRRKKKMPPRGKDGRFLKRASRKRRKKNQPTLRGVGTLARRVRARAGPTLRGGAGTLARRVRARARARRARAGGIPRMAPKAPRRKTTLQRGVTPMARRRTPPRGRGGRFRARRRAVGRAAPRRRYRAMRRNQPRMRLPNMQNMIQGGMDALFGGAGVTAGKIVSRQGITLFNQDPGTPIGIAAQLAIAVAAGVILRMFNIKGPFADGVIYGAASGAAESTLKLVMPGQAEMLLGEYGSNQYGLSAYGTGAPVPALVPDVNNAGMAAYGMQ